MTHVLVAGTEEVARVLNAAKNRETVEGWIVPKKAHEGDKAIFYLPPHVLAARGEILGEPEGGQGEYRADVRVIEKLEPALRPLCPNCHAVVHFRTPPLSIQKLKAMLKVARLR